MFVKSTHIFISKTGNISVSSRPSTLQFQQEPCLLYNLKLSPVLDVCHNDIKLGSKIPEIHIQIHKHPYIHTHTHTLYENFTPQRMKVINT
jgi:hypothetical protein